MNSIAGPLMESKLSNQIRLQRMEVVESTWRRSYDKKDAR